METDSQFDDIASLAKAARGLLSLDAALSGGIVASGGAQLDEIQPQTRQSSTQAEIIGEDMPVDKKEALLAELAEVTNGCTNCQLHSLGRKQVVFGDGSPNADLMFVGEGPGAEEDAQGIPFVGRSGELLTKMIIAMGLDRTKVYIGNVVKCRPPGNRTPTPDEAQACWQYLRRQIEIIQPKAIVVLGNAAAKMLLETKIGITKLRGNWQELWGIPVMPTFHPAYLLRQYTPENRKRVWSDLQAVMDKLGLEMPK